MIKKNILFIDTWTHANRFISPVVDEFKKNGHECKLLHCDSIFLNSRYNHLKASDNQNIESIDLKIFKYSFDKAISEIKPDLIIFISIHGIVQRWANFVSNKKNIPIFFFMHGIRISSPSKIKSSIPYKLNRVLFYSKVYRYLLFDYFRSSPLSIKNAIFMLKYYIELIFKNHSYSNNPNINLGFNYDTLFVNNIKDISYFKNNYPVSDNSKFIISGNVSSLTPAIKSLKIEHKKNCLLFISQTEVYEKGIMLKLLNKLKELSIFFNLELIFRPHPRDYENKILAEKLDINISIVSEEKDMARTMIAVGLNSALMIGMMGLNKHILQVIHNNNLNICNQFDYENMSLLDTSDLDNFIFNESKFENNKNKEHVLIHSPVKIIRNSIYKRLSIT